MAFKSIAGSVSAHTSAFIVSHFCHLIKEHTIGTKLRVGGDSSSYLHLHLYTVVARKVKIDFHKILVIDAKRNVKIYYGFMQLFYIRASRGEDNSEVGGTYWHLMAWGDSSYSNYH